MHLGCTMPSQALFGSYLDDLDEHQMRTTLPSLFATLDAGPASRSLDNDRVRDCPETDGNAPFVSWSGFLDVAVDRPGAPGQ